MPKGPTVPGHKPSKARKASGRTSNGQPRARSVVDHCQPVELQRDRQDGQRDETHQLQLSRAQQGAAGDDHGQDRRRDRKP